MRGKLVFFLTGIIFSVVLCSCNNDPITPVNTLRVRKNVKNLTSSERADFVNAILLLKNTPSPYQPALSYYDQFVSWHRDAFYCDTMAGHMGPGFFPWHRQFLIMFEKAMSSVSHKDIVLPYWDWTDQECTNSVYMDDFMGGNGNPAQGYALTTGPFRKDVWVIKVFAQLSATPYMVPYIIRAFGTYPNQPVLPTSAEVDSCLLVSIYDSSPYDVSVNPSLSFRNSIEGWRACTYVCTDTIMETVCTQVAVMHNRVHLWGGGKSGDTTGTLTQNTSPNDPVFWPHHTNIDRIWSKWINRYGEVYVPVSGAHYGQNLNDLMWPYYRYGDFVTPKNMLNSRNLGYYYQEE